MTVRVQTAAFDMGAELNAFSEGLEAGAVVSFTGLVRDAGRMVAMEIEHYPAMTERAITAIVQEATARWSLERALVIHRHGRLMVGEPIMMVATAARHRAGAFQAAEFLMDYLKSRAPFWKKEIGAEGEVWVEAKASDEDALTRW
ncbi:molybdenum cofactor biosynthesis protein MoaE [Falsirhodobacter sp. 20TX0035]|uniref:molybdenum cofactor biosynthesis protein MoaE n=1 Tax=Falsirhodobacter sp. 20TX0035 TaxID=3022019 RepID=UPI00232C940B|nr:molybdenum cofactor biosynthesis protein MoaE [Falsirhodobacter sp. 20TX0035]MDB6455171.1 molybdenum cofactor biosynthesis protein MoaE [Falsirhodobacter sp. 20TX0035]